DDVVIGEADAARGDGLANGPGLGRAVDAIKGGADIESARAHRIVRTPRHECRKVGDALAHCRGRGPGRPFSLAGDAVSTAPGETVATDANAILHSLAIFEHEIETALAGLDDDR